MTERKYPCQAKIVADADDLKYPELAGAVVTVLTEKKWWSCCCACAHAVELPEGFPEPPAGCDYWMIEHSLEFIEEGGTQ